MWSVEEIVMNDASVEGIPRTRMYGGVCPKSELCYAIEATAAASNGSTLHTLGYASY